MTAPMYVPRFFVRQRITLMVNRYEISAANPDGTEGALLAFAEQKRMKLKEEVRFFADESKTRPVFSFKARQRLDVHAEHDVLDEHGTPLGWFKKEFGASLLRSTWHLSGAGSSTRPGRSAGRSSRSCAASGTSSPTSATSGCRSSSTSTSSTRSPGSRC